MKPLNVAVIGVGHLGEHHARLYASLKDVNLVGVVDNNEERRQFIADKYNLKAFAKYTDIKEPLDAVSLVVPTNQHYAMALELIEKNIHILIEKPITEDVAQAEEIVKKAREKNLILQVGHIERFNPALISIKKILTNPKFIEVHRLAPYKKRGVDVGVVLDLMIHDIDIVFHLVQSPIKDIKASGVCVLTNNEDIANARIEFTNGCVANLTASRISTDELRKIRIFQEDAYLSLDYKNQEAIAYKKVNNTIISEKIPSDKKEPLKLELASFIQCIKEAKEPQVSGEQGKQALETAVNIVEQIRNNNS